MALSTQTTPDWQHYLSAARKRFTQSEIAAELGVEARTVRRWEARETEPAPYLVPALQRLLPLELPFAGEEKFRFIDLFAGIGGIRLAFESIGGRCIFTSEWDSYAQKTYAENHRDGHPINGDITQVDAAQIPDHDVLLAGFPCQPFSIAGVSKKNALGRAHGFQDETQGTLFFDVARIIDKKRPRAFLLENVKNLLSHDKGRTFDVIRRTLQDELGYHIHYRVVNGAHFTPQNRERILIVGFREPVAFDWDAIPLPPKGNVTLSHILHQTDGSEPLLPWDGERFFNHTSRSVPDKYTLTPKLWQYLQDYAAKHRSQGNGFGFGLVGPHSITRTLSARYYKDGSEILVDQGPNQRPRRLTPRECARLMGFPDSFRIPVSDTRAYQQFAASPMPPMIAPVANAMQQALYSSVTVTPIAARLPEGLKVKSKNWTREQILVAINLYCQLPFGKLHKGNPLIIEIAKLIGRTPDALAMKLTNLASLDPAITETGRKGLPGSSSLDKEIWAEFLANPDAIGYESQVIVDSLAQQDKAVEALSSESEPESILPSFFAENIVVKAKIRVKQSFFRKAVLSSYENRCCMTGLGDSRLLIASHIAPWSHDEHNRLNPANGLCLSALHDKAFDRGLITVTPDYQIKVSSQLQDDNSKLAKDYLLSLDNKKITLPKKFSPLKDLLAYHAENIFIQ